MPTPPTSARSRGRDMAIKALNARLPKKRVIAQGLLRDPQGDILLCELTYKAHWDLPGGVVDPGESPATAVQREVREELGLDVEPGALVAVNWLPPYRGWDDAVLLLFDLGTLPRERAETFTLLPREIAGVHWVAPADLADHVAPYVADMLGRVVPAGAPGEARAALGPTAYLENSDARGPR